MENSSTFELTFTQSKMIINSLGRDQLENFLESINDQPEFLKFMGEISDVAELIAIYEGGCASGAYMPAVTYYTAKKCLFECEGTLADQLDGYGAIEWDHENEELGGFAVKICSIAVENYVSQFSDLIEVLQQTDY